MEQSKHTQSPPYLLGNYAPRTIFQILAPGVLLQLRILAFIYQKYLSNLSRLRGNFKNTKYTKFHSSYGYPD